MTPTAQTFAVHAALRELPDRHRQALELTRSGQSYRQVGQALGLPPERVGVLVLQAVLALSRARLAVTPAMVSTSWH